MQRPKVGDHYKVYLEEGLSPYNIMKIVNVNGNFAFYEMLGYSGAIQRWNYIEFPDCLKQKLTDLEVELL